MKNTPRRTSKAKAPAPAAIIKQLAVGAWVAFCFGDADDGTVNEFYGQVTELSSDGESGTLRFNDGDTAEVDFDPDMRDLYPHVVGRWCMCDASPQSNFHTVGAILAPSKKAKKDASNKRSASTSAAAPMLCDGDGDGDSDSEMQQTITELRSELARLTVIVNDHKVIITGYSEDINRLKQQTDATMFRTNAIDTRLSTAITIGTDKLLSDQLAVFAASSESVRALVPKDFMDKMFPDIVGSAAGGSFPVFNYRACFMYKRFSTSLPYGTCKSLVLKRAVIDPASAGGGGGGGGSGKLVVSRMGDTAWDGLDEDAGDLFKRQFYMTKRPVAIPLVVTRTLRSTMAASEACRALDGYAVCEACSAAIGSDKFVPKTKKDCLCLVCLKSQATSTNATGDRGVPVCVGCDTLIGSNKDDLSFAFARLLPVLFPEVSDIVFGHNAIGRFTPDTHISMSFASRRLHVIIESDTQQHKNATSAAENERIWHMAYELLGDEGGPDSAKLLVLRYDPHAPFDSMSGGRVEGPTSAQRILILRSWVIWWVFCAVHPYEHMCVPGFLELFAFYDAGSEKVASARQFWGDQFVGATACYPAKKGLPEWCYMVVPQEAVNLAGMDMKSTASRAEDPRVVFAHHGCFASRFGLPRPTL